MRRARPVVVLVAYVHQITPDLTLLSCPAAVVAPSLAAVLAAHDPFACRTPIAPAHVRAVIAFALDTQPAHA